MTRQVENQNIVNRRIIFGLYHQDRLILLLGWVYRSITEGKVVSVSFLDVSYTNLGVCAINF